MIELIPATLNMMVALACGALIGSERQVRQRMAGLRTNALVALGAAGFVVFSQLVEHDASPTRVAAQVVSGIGFLGAGIIFREGFNVHGLNTAATLTSDDLAEAIEHAVQRIAAEPGIRSLRWMPVDDI